MENFQTYIDQAWSMILSYAPKVLLALITLLIGLRIIKAVLKMMDKMMAKRDMDQTLRPFVLSMIGWGLKAMLFISIASMVGIETTSFVAILGAAGLAIGFALQGTLGNLAGGVMLMVFKPFKVGDLIEAQGHLGVVDEIQIFTTHLTSPQNKKVIIPNGAISNGDIVNYTILGKIRVDMTVGVSYNADIDQVKQVLTSVLKENGHVLSDPAPFVGVSELGDNSVNMAVRPYAKPEHYWDVYFDIYEKSKKALDANKISIPFPQMDVHLFKQG